MSVAIALASVGAGVVLYVGISVFFLKNPQFLHKKKKIPFNACHISHRGGAGECLENTLTAFQHAVDCGTEMLELDCQITKDNQVVVSHDENLRRTTGVNVHIGDCRYDELPLLQESLIPNRAYFFAPCDDRRIPLLKEVFENFPNIPINIDIKVDDDRLIREVSSLVKSYNREQITVWGNFRDVICQKCYTHNPNIHMLFSLKRVVYLILSFYAGILPFIPVRENFFEIVMPDAYLTDPHLLSPGALSRKQRLLLRVIDSLIMRRWLFEHLRKRGVRVYVWVLNSESHFERAFSLGVDGVMTDFPTKLNEYLSKNSIMA